MSRKITHDFEKELHDAFENKEAVIIPYTREDGKKYDMEITVEDFFEIKGRKYVWALKDGVPGRYRSLRLESIG